MKKAMKDVAATIISFIGETAMKDRPISFRIVVATLVLGTGLFVTMNLINAIL